MGKTKINTWIEDLSWCPSQIYYYFLGKDKKKYCIYLRWRWNDPWTASLTKCKNDWEMDFMTPWENINLSRDYKDQEYKDLEIEVYKTVNKAVGILKQPSIFVYLFSKLMNIIKVRKKE